eukprot:210352_1
MTSAFKYVKANGLVEESEYPYVARDQTCKIDKGPHKVTGYTEISDVDNLKKGLAIGPVSVAVDASRFSLYTGGVFECTGSVRLNHGITAVGYNSEYWIVRNSWGTKWGEQGFMKIKMGDTCGIAKMACYPTVPKL